MVLDEHLGVGNSRVYGNTDLILHVLPFHITSNLLANGAVM